jgi:hypothetical protein
MTKGERNKDKEGELHKKDRMDIGGRIWTKEGDQLKFCAHK